MVADPEYVKSKYNLHMLREIENLVAEAVEIQVPLYVPYFNPFCGPRTSNEINMACSRV